ncbi:MAG: hypothetical protein GXY32_11375 [Ruminococcaceae bacterium]|nr:hypothetical protein [Oscillospiraceae bacterium]
MLGAIKIGMEGTPDCLVLHIEAHALLGRMLDALKDDSYSFSGFLDAFAQYDALLVDQLEDIGGKETCMEEFMHLIRGLLSRGVSVAVALCLRAGRQEDAALYQLLWRRPLCERQYNLVFSPAGDGWELWEDEPHTPV